MSAGLRAATIAVLEFPPVGRRLGRGGAPLPCPLLPFAAGEEAEAQTGKLSHRPLCEQGVWPSPLQWAPRLFFFSSVLSSHLGLFYESQASLPIMKKGSWGGFYSIYCKVRIIS